MTVRDVPVNDVAAAVEKLFMDASFDLPDAVTERLERAAREEASPTGRAVLAELLENARIAREERVPICQDTGLAVIFIEVGQDVHLTGGNFRDAVDEGVRRAYQGGYLRKSCCDPFGRANTRDNTPAIVHTSIVAGERIKIVAMPKGGGSENCSQVRMLSPSQGIEGVREFVLDVVRTGGPNPCPPVIVGVGIGGNFETSALLSKEALMVPFGQRNSDPRVATLESDLLREINASGIGPGGYGGRVTALDVHVKMLPCHIASLPVAVNIQCHAHRIREMML
jgi:fumarate hydratase subunit alpha